MDWTNAVDRMNGSLDAYNRAMDARRQQAFQTQDSLAQSGLADATQARDLRARQFAENQRQFNEGGRQFDSRMGVLQQLFGQPQGYRPLPTNALAAASQPEQTPGATIGSMPVQPQGDGINRGQINNALTKYLMGFRGLGV